MAKQRKNPGPGLTDATDSGREVAGGAVGGVGGAVGGGALGAIAGPVGAIIGAVAGAAGGWWAGKEVAASSFDFSDADDRYYRSAFERMGDPSGSVRSYDDARPLYEFGTIARQNPDYRERSFEEIEPDLRRGWSPELSRRYGDWSTVRGYVSEGYGRERDEEVVVEKRPVVKEEVVLRTRAVEDTEDVEADLRRERVDVDDRSGTRREDRPETR